MQHFAARQHSETGKWKYTGAGRRSGVYEAGGCSRFRTCKDCGGNATNMTDTPRDGDCIACGGKGVIEDESRCLGHDTAEEAYAHHKEYLLDERTRFTEDSANASSQHRCKAPGCAAFTSGAAWVGGYTVFPLCAEHRTREVVSGLLEVGESWES